MKLRCYPWTVLLATAAALITPAFAADASAEAGRALGKRYADAVVGIELVVIVKLKAGDREMPPREQRVEVNGTVISASGLTVTSLAEVDPQTTIEAMRPTAPGGGRLELLGADFKEVKLRLADGTEVPARFVLKDGDLDLAFMAPDYDAPKREFAHVNLAEATEGRALDRFLLIGRASKVLQRVPLVRTSEVMGVVEKPRRFYLMSDLMVGSPSFDAAGMLLGVAVQHFANGRRAGVVVLPAADIAESAKQAAAAQAAPRPAEPVPAAPAAAAPAPAPATPPPSN